LTHPRRIRYCRWRSVVVDAEGRIKNALDDLFAGKERRQPEAKTLGCALETW